MAEIKKKTFLKEENSVTMVFRNLKTKSTPVDNYL
jgi:hypothetical protein